MQKVNFPFYKGLDTLPNLKYQAGTSFNKLLSTLDLSGAGVYIVWGVSEDVPDWMIDSKRVAYVGKSKKLKNRVGSCKHSTIGSLRYLDASFNISFVFCEDNEEELDLLEREAISWFTPQWNVTSNEPEFIAPHNVYGLLPYIVDAKGDVSEALDNYACDFPKLYLGEEFTKLQVLASGLNRNSLSFFKASGEHLFKIREMLRVSTPKNPVTTELGTFTSFSDYLKFREINNKTAYTHIFIYENWELAEKIGLLEENACFRLVISEKIIRWAKDKLEDNPDWQGVAEDYFKEQSAKATEKKESTKSELIHLRARLAELEAEVLLVPKYMERINQLETKCQNLEVRLEEYRAIVLPYITE
jgi:hypothetical protein